MALKKEHKIWLGVGIGVLVIGTTGIVLFRNKQEKTDETDETEPLGVGRAEVVPTAGTEKVVNIPVVSRPVVRPNTAGNMFGIPTAVRPSINPLSNPPAGSTVYKQFSLNERIAPKSDGTFVFVFNTRPEQGFLTEGESIYITGTNGLFDGVKTIEKLFIDANGKIGGVYLRLNNPTISLAAKAVLSANEYIFQGKASAQKKQ